jgi:hypothetical protein
VFLNKPNVSFIPTLTEAYGISFSSPLPEGKADLSTALQLRFHIRYARVQPVSRRPLAAEVSVPFQGSLCWICGGQSGTGLRFFPISIIQSTLRIQLFYYRRCRVTVVDSIVKLCT